MPTIVGGPSESNMKTASRKFSSWITSQAASCVTLMSLPREKSKSTSPLWAFRTIGASTTLTPDKLIHGEAVRLLREPVLLLGCQIRRLHTCWWTVQTFISCGNARYHWCHQHHRALKSRKTAMSCISVPNIQIFVTLENLLSLLTVNDVFWINLLSSISGGFALFFEATSSVRRLSYMLLRSGIKIRRLHIVRSYRAGLLLNNSTQTFIHCASFRRPYQVNV